MADKEKGEKFIDKEKGDVFKPVSGKIKITPKRDFVLHSPPIAENVRLVKDEEIEIDKIFEAALKTEKVI